MISSFDWNIFFIAEFLIHNFYFINKNSCWVELQLSGKRKLVSKIFSNTKIFLRGAKQDKTLHFPYDCHKRKIPRTLYDDYSLTNKISQLFPFSRQSDFLSGGKTGGLQADLI